MMHRPRAACGPPSARAASTAVMREGTRAGTQVLEYRRAANGGPARERGAAAAAPRRRTPAHDRVLPPSGLYSLLVSRLLRV